MTIYTFICRDKLFQISGGHFCTGSTAEPTVHLMHPALGLKDAEKKQSKVRFMRDLNSHSLTKQQVRPHGSRVRAQHLKKKPTQSIACILQLYRHGNTTEDLSLFHFRFKNSYKTKLRVEAAAPRSTKPPQPTASQPQPLPSRTPQLPTPAACCAPALWRFMAPRSTALRFFMSVTYRAVTAYSIS